MTIYFFYFTAFKIKMCSIEDTGYKNNILALYIFGNVCKWISNASFLHNPLIISIQAIVCISCSQYEFSLVIQSSIAKLLLYSKKQHWQFYPDIMMRPIISYPNFNRWPILCDDPMNLKFNSETIYYLINLYTVQTFSMYVLNAHLYHFVKGKFMFVWNVYMHFCPWCHLLWRNSNIDMCIFLSV